MPQRQQTLVLLKRERVLRQFMTLLLRCEQIDVQELLIPKHVERLLNLVKNHFVKKVLVMPDKEVTLPHYTVEEELYLAPGPEIILNRLIVRIAFSAALSNRIEAGDVFVVDEFKVDGGKTKSFVAKVNETAGVLNCLIVSNNFTAETYLSARNVADTQLVTALDVNTEELLNYDKIIITEGAMPTLSKRTTL
jgi:hypothetical protein